MRRQRGDNDFVFLSLLEPHMLGQTFVDSVFELLQTLGVKRYTLLGSMYDMVPYTRPLMITGHVHAASGATRKAGVLESDYVGPTSLTAQITQRAAEAGIETATLIVHLPSYLGLEEDYRGQTRLIEALSPMYGFQNMQEDLEKAAEQYDSVAKMAEEMLRADPRYRNILQELEHSYDARVHKTAGSSARLSPEPEQLLQELGKKLD
ncbi:MAG: PAC2 family protein [Chloroflexi bacterium]|nr:PAC2 family protein [Chloroflexota bacterium]